MDIDTLYSGCVTWDLLLGAAVLILAAVVVWLLYQLPIVSMHTKTLESNDKSIQGLLEITNDLSKRIDILEGRNQHDREV